MRHRTGVFNAGASILLILPIFWPFLLLQALARYLSPKRPKNRRRF